MQQILDIGFDRLPTDEDFYHALSGKINKDLELYYDDEGWLQFEADLLFLIKNEGKIITYKKKIYYWFRHKDSYLVIKNIESYSDMYVNKTRTLEKAFEMIFITEDEIFGGIHRGVVEEKDFKLPNTFKQIMNTMIKHNTAEVESLLHELESGKFISIDELNRNFSFDPISTSVMAYMVLDKGKLIITGIKIKSGEDIRFYDRGKVISYMITIPPDDVALVLATLVYNPKTHKVVDIIHY